MKNAEIKVSARARLLGCTAGVYAMSATAFFVWQAPFSAAAAVLLSGLPSVVPLIFVCAAALCFRLVFCATALRNNRRFWRAACGNPSKTPFPGTAAILREFRARTLLFVLRTAWLCLFELPFAATAACALLMLYRGCPLSVFLILSGFSLLLLLVGLGVYFVAVQRYALCIWLLAGEKRLSARETIKTSARLMDARCLSFAVFKLSFLPWLIPCLLVLPLPSVWGYYKQSCAIRAHSVVFPSAVSSELFPAPQ